MSPFRGILYDTYKDRRYAALFLLTLFGLILLPIILVAMTLYGVSQGWSALCRARENRRNRWRHAPLSRDELRVARSKLVKAQTLKRI